MIRVADYIAQALAAHGIRHVFMVTGGAAMHLNDAIGRCHGLSYVCCTTSRRRPWPRRATTVSPTGWPRSNVTAGPGATNAITGVFGAWTDSLGMVVVSGQVKWETLVRSTGAAAPPARRPGSRHHPPGRADHQVRGPGRPTRSVALPPGAGASSGTERPARDRSGSTSRATSSPRIDRPEALARSSAPRTTGVGPATLPAACETIVERLPRAERPVLLARCRRAAGRRARSVPRAGRSPRVPVVTGFNAHDLVPHDHPC